MDYEQKYKETLERAKKLQETCDSTAVVGWCEYIFPELKESEDERIRKAILNYLTKMWGNSQDDVCGVHVEDAIAWLEKQDSQILANSAKTCKDEQKPADEIEPKFHKGDWITNGDYTWKIVEVKSLDYILQSQDGNVVDDTISHVNEQFHSFTIQDAKDGDVLAAYECYVIFKEIDGLNIKCYCTYHYMNNPSFHVDTLQNKDAFHPATKEQRDLLFQKMKESGYEWNAENKEIKKISQRIISAEAKEAMYDKPAWSEEDEEELFNAVYACLNFYGKDSDTADWLKSLRERIKDC